MARHTAPADEAQFESIHAVVDALGVGDEFDVFVTTRLLRRLSATFGRTSLFARKASVVSWQRITALSRKTRRMRNQITSFRSKPTEKMGRLNRSSLTHPVLKRNPQTV